LLLVLGPLALGLIDIGCQNEEAKVSRQQEDFSLGKRGRPAAASSGGKFIHGAGRKNNEVRRVSQSSEGKKKMSKRTKVILGVGFLLIVAYALAQTFQAPGLGIPGDGTMVGGSDYGSGCTGNAGSIPCFHPVAVNNSGAVSITGTVTATGTTAGTADPCLSSAIAKSSIPINLSSAATTQLVALSGTTSIYVCGFVLTDTGVTTATTIQLEYGTGSTCGTGTTALTGTFAQSLLTSAIVVNVAGGTQIKAPSGNALCAVVAGTTPSIQGYLTYVQQ
jgi:hypothetical protein